MTAFSCWSKLCLVEKYSHSRLLYMRHKTLQSLDYMLLMAGVWERMKKKRWERGGKITGEASISSFIDKPFSDPRLWLVWWQQIWLTCAPFSVGSAIGQTVFHVEAWVWQRKHREHSICYRFHHETTILIHNIKYSQQLSYIKYYIQYKLSYIK